jgi:integrase
MQRLRPMKPHVWPRVDRTAWQLANSEASSLFSNQGKALELRPATRALYERAYGVWLAFLAQRGKLDPHEKPAQRVTRERVQLWLADMEAIGRAKGTIGLYLISLRGILQIIDPSPSHNFLLRPWGRTVWRAFPTTPKYFPPQDFDDLMRHLEVLHAFSQSCPDHEQKLIAIRDCALMALFLMYAPRLGDVTRMRLGTRLLISDDGLMTVCFPGEETKGKRLLQYPLHDACAVYIRRYIDSARRVFAGDGFTDAVWLSPGGHMLRDYEIASIFRHHTKNWLGKGYGPHTARKWLRSSAAKRSPQAAFDTAQVLGHSPAVSLRHYAEATDRQATRRHASNLSELRKRTRSLAERLYAAE